jgi:prepilin-type N-terminal cleavage/methylation domain-containing protein
MRLTRIGRRLDDEQGFSIVESIVAITILAVGALAIAQAITFGLDTSGLARQRLGARAGLEQQMELARALNFDTLVLDDADPIPHSTDPENPDYWVDEDAQTFDPDGDGPLDPEPIVREAGAQPALHHIQTPFVQGTTTFSVYLYITWVDQENDGLGVDDSADGNGDGEFDGNGQDGKRVVVTVTWQDTLTDRLNSQSTTSLFTPDSVPFHESGVEVNLNPDVSCPTVTSYSDLSYDFAASATDADGSVVAYDWAIRGQGTVNYVDDYFTNAGATLHYDFPEDGSYWVDTYVTDDDGGGADNTSLNCQVTASTTSNNATGNGGPPGTVVVAGDATLTNQTQVTLTLSCATCSGGSKMQFSSDGSTWTTKVSYATSALFTMTSGDGSKTVYARFWQSGKYGAWATDTITLDQTPPNGPTSLYKVSSVNSGPDKIVTIQWTLPNPTSADQAGYYVWTRATTSTGAFDQTACTVITTNRCSMTLKKSTNFSVYLTYYDTAGNQSVASNTITV